jgi:hypothetical protein
MREGAQSVFRHRVDLVAARVRKTPMATRILIARLEQAFAIFARVPYNDARAQRELEQLMDGLEDLTRAPGTRHLR